MNRLLRSSILRAAALVLVASSLVACGDDDDTGGGPIIMIDAGADLGPAPVDMGPPPPVDMGPACMPANLTPLPAEALPRCTAETGAAVVACGVPSSMAAATCIQNALEADTTAPLAVMGGSLDCSGCFNLQQLACFYENGCDSQFDAFFCCLDANACTNPSACPACSRELTAVQMCAGGVGECFDASTGYPSECFAAPAPAMDAGTPATDAGSPAADAGTPDTDAGTPDTDAGTPDTDAGPPAA
jgi:hypothetical protein